MPFPIILLEAREELGRDPTPYDFTLDMVKEIVDSLEHCIKYTDDENVLDILNNFHEQFVRFYTKDSMRSPEDFLGLNIQDLIKQTKE